MPQPATPHSPGQEDERLFVLEHEGWTAAIKQEWTKEYCFGQNPGEDHYHLLLCGEIYLQRGTEKYCLNCASRHGFATHDRTYWQKGPGSVATAPLPAAAEGYTPQDAI